MDNTALIKRIEVRLKELGKTKGEFYKGAGVSSASYSQWNTGEYSPSKKKLQTIADYLGVSVDYLLAGDASAPAPPPEALTPPEQAHIQKYRALDEHGREVIDAILDIEHRRVKGPAKVEAPPEPPPAKVIPLYYTPAAAGYASPAFGEDYEDYEVPASSRADFAAKIQGDSMEPWIADGSVVLVKRERVEIGDVGLFFVDGDMKCKQYCQDNFGNVYLFSLNRKRADADVTIFASSGITLCCFGRVLLDKRPPLPMG